MAWRLAIFLFLLPISALAKDWDALKEPGAMAIMRHALAPGTGDPADLTLGDCSTQRNLDARGRAQAEAIGAAFRARGITFTAVHSSQWCRTMETAKLLGLGPVQETPALNSFFRDTSTRNAQTEAVRILIAEAEAPIMMVTHFVKIRALTGQATGSGEVLIIRAVNGDIELLGRVLIEP